MKRGTLRRCLWVVSISALAMDLWAVAPVVSNVRVQQRAGTKLVDITYNLSDGDGDACTIEVLVSGDGGLTWAIPARTLSGAAGGGVTPGYNRNIVWNAGADWDGQYVTDLKVRVAAHDGTTPPAPPGMVYIAPGPFQMGDSFYEGETDELPLHNVQLDGFFLDRLEVTREMWINVTTWSSGHGYDISGGSYVGEGFPVSGVNWYNAVKWCNARSEKEGLAPAYYTDAVQTNVYRAGYLNISNDAVDWTANGYRLPTEAEWEKAARGMLYAKRYPWGDSMDGSNANYFNSGDPYSGSGVAPAGYYNGGQTPAGPDMANGYGLYDMAGNLNEWCWDRYQSTYYAQPESENNPRGPASGGSRIYRGSSFAHYSEYLRLARRGETTGLTTVYSDMGFRCARRH